VTGLRDQPGPFFGDFGGRFMPESLVAAIDELSAAYEEAKADPAFQQELAELHRTYTGRPSIITEVPRFAEHAGGARIILKREDLNHTGSHKINNVLGQALLTKRIGKKRVIAETGAGQHGVATATAAALFGLECTVFMGEVDTQRQALNVARMRLLGAEVVSVTTGSRSYVLQDEDGQTIESHSISAGLDYPGVGPEHAHLHELGRATYLPASDAEAMDALRLLSRTEGIIPAIESAHALAGVLKLGRELGPDAIILVNLSGRGDKDVATAGKWFDLFDEGAIQS